MIIGIGNLVATTVLNKTEGDKNRNKMEGASKQEKHLTYLKQQTLTVKSQRQQEVLAKRDHSHISTMSTLQSIKDAGAKDSQTVERNQEKLSSIQL